MKAITQTRYGDVDALQIQEVSPVQVSNPNELLVEVMAANVSSGDYKLNTMAVSGVAKLAMQLLYGKEKPKHLVRGIAGAGIVRAVGANVKTVEVGDRINFINSKSLGVMANHVILNRLSSVYAPIHEGVTFEEAAPVAFGAMSAMNFMNGQYVFDGSRVLIYGASGSVGTYAISLAKVYGATVTAVARKKHWTQLYELGADRWVDPTSSEFEQLQAEYDVVFDAHGSMLRSKAQSLLALGGRFFSINTPTQELSHRLEELNFLAARKSLITILDSVYDFADYKQAFQRVYEGHKTGNVVLRINPNVKASAPVPPTPKAKPEPKPQPKPKPEPTQPVKKASTVKASGERKTHKEWLAECNIVKGVYQSSGVVQTLGATLKTTKTDFKQNQSVRIALHPEDLYVDPKGPIQLHVESVGFRGVSYTIKAKYQQTELHIESLDPVDEGEMVRFNIHARDVHVLKQ